MTFDDARNFLFTTRERYDLIVSEPSNPWIAGVATLFTSEFYRAAQSRLLPGGVFRPMGAGVFPVSRGFAHAPRDVSFGISRRHALARRCAGPDPDGAKPSGRRNSFARAGCSMPIPACMRISSSLGWSDPAGTVRFLHARRCGPADILLRRANQYRRSDAARISRAAFSAGPRPGRQESRRAFCLRNRMSCRRIFRRISVMRRSLAAAARLHSIWTIPKARIVF